mmetsp:Transcript_88371/g.245319  ORF Transcript_88371/g.245319 Transcript_88371/m.245319 type:complete len:207 (+) Transcript_88371:1488-2108(+)
MAAFAAAHGDGKDCRILIYAHAEEVWAGLPRLQRHRVGPYPRLLDLEWAGPLSARVWYPHFACGNLELFMLSVRPPEHAVRTRRHPHSAGGLGCRTVRLPETYLHTCAESVEEQQGGQEAHQKTRDAPHALWQCHRLRANAASVQRRQLHRLCSANIRHTRLHRVVTQELHNGSTVPVIIAHLRQEGHTPTEGRHWMHGSGTPRLQ